MRVNVLVVGKNRNAGLLGWLTNMFSHVIEACHLVEEKAAVYASLECMANDLLGRGVLTPRQQEAVRAFKLQLQKTEDKVIDTWLATTDVPKDSPSPLLSVRQRRVAGTAGASLSTALLLAACNGGGEVTATKIATEFAKTQTPIAETATPEPTGTATPEPTRAPAEVAGELDLKSEPLYQGRTFEYEERNGTTYLVDTYNDAPKAVLQEDGTWRKLDYTNNEDAETMYGALVPRDGEYIDPEMHYSGGVPVGRDLRTRFLGDWEVDKVEYKGQEMDMYFLRAGLRDGDGELHVARLALDAPGFMTEHVTYVQCITESGRGPTMGNGWHVSTWTEDLLIQLHPGESLAMFVDEPVWRKPRPFGSQNVVMSGVEYPEFNNAQSVLLSTLYSEQPDQYQLSPAEKAAMGQGKWPDRTATLVMRDILSIYRGSVQECPQYHWR